MKRLIIGSSVLLLITLIAVVTWRLTPIRRTFYTDADSIRVPIAAAPVRDILWQPPIDLADTINTDGDDYEPRLSADGMTLFFVRGKAGHNADIYVALRSPDGWTDPQPLNGVNSEADDLGPEPAPDGESLYFYSNREGTLGGFDLWTARRTAEGWGEVSNLGPLVNSEFNDYGPAITHDGATLYFSSNRPQPTDDDEPDPNAWPATLREDLYYRTYDLFAAAVTERGIGSAVTVASLNTPFNEGAPAVSSYGDFVYFASDRPGGEGGFDLYRARRLDGAHEPATNLGGAVNTAANELDPALSLGGFALHFSSDRPKDDAKPADATTPAPPPQRNYDLYRTTSREVFLATEQEGRPPIDWAALWRTIGPNLLWALLALLLLLLMLALFRNMQERKISLLAKCLLASLAAHLLLLLLFNAWEVAASLAGEFRRRGPIQVALASPTTGDRLAAQIRGNLTEIEPPRAPEVVSQRQTEPLDTPPIDALAMMTVDRRPIETVDSPQATLNLEDAIVTRSTELTIDLEALDRAEPPPQVEMPLPTDQARVDSSEPEAAHEASPVEPARLDRPDLAAAHVDTESLTVALKPAGRQPEQDAADPQSLVDAVDLPDRAPPSAASLPPPVEENSFAQRVVLADLSLPSPPTERLVRVESDEPPLISPTAAFVDFLNERPRSDGVVVLASGGVTVSITPTGSPVAADDSLLPDKLAANVTDAAPPPAASDIEFDAVAELPVPLTAPETELTLPTPDTASAEATVETAPSVRAASSVPPRSQVAEDVLTEVTPTVTALSEIATPPALNDDSLLADRAIEIADASPPDAASDARHLPPSDTSLPPVAPLIGLTLPTMESAETTPAHESAPQVAPVIPDAPRPAVEVFADATMPKAVDLPAAGDQWQRDDDPRVDQSVITPPPLMQVEPNPTTLAMSLEPIDPMATIPFESLALELDLPVEEIAPESPYMQRFDDDRQEIVERMGGSEETERAVALALRWLAAHQSDDGRWDADGFDEGCGECGGETQIAADNALTGLGLLCFLGAGHTHTRPGPYRENVQRGLNWLVAQEGSNGDLRGKETMYSQAIATIAISEAYAMTGDSRLAGLVERAVDYIHRARNRDVGGWRYDPGQAGDTSVLGWQVMALKSAKMAGIEVPSRSFDTARAWLDLVSPRNHPGHYAYQPGHEPTPSMTAEGMFTQLLVGLDPRHPRMRASADFILQHLPDWESDPNTYFWYYASLALFQQQGEAWEIWNEAVTEELVEHQRSDGRATGSWDPVDEWARVGGRVYQTALCTLMLEVYYRYLPLYSLGGADKLTDVVVPDGMTGILRGVVTDSFTGRPLPGATVRLDLPDGATVKTAADVEGHYALLAPQVPEFFALSASLEGYVPDTVSVERERLESGTLMVDFELEPAGRATLVTEAIPDVHHLGDNRFDGRINSQFQKESEGSSFAATFELAADQLPPHHNRAEVVLLAKGVQRRHSIFINDNLLDDRLDDAPSDGSFGEFVVSFDASYLKAGENAVRIVAKPSDTDIDDFEFVNVRIRLSP